MRSKLSEKTWDVWPSSVHTRIESYDQEASTMKSGDYFLAVSWSDKAIPRYFRALSKEFAEAGRQVVILVGDQKQAL